LRLRLVRAHSTKSASKLATTWKQREAAERAEERLRASEKRALLEIDRERSTATMLRKKLDEAARRSERKDADHRRAIEAVQAQLGDVRHQVGVLQGRLDAVQAENMRLQVETTTLREAETRARETQALSASAGVRSAPRPTRSSRTVPAAKPATRRKKAV
jgi:predicted  nucleic acid-binding Zn-ribbon protein